jgi:protein-disulfide isomerase
MSLAATALVPAVSKERDHLRGDAGPTLLVFGDYECPYTRRAYRSVQSLEAEGVPLRFVFRHFPLTEIHPHALGAAQASEAAAVQERFWAMHDLLFRRQTALEPADLDRYAMEIGLDAERFTRDVRTHAYLERVEADRESALASGALGTPTIFVDGALHHGGYAPADLRRAFTTAGRAT